MQVPLEGGVNINAVRRAPEAIAAECWEQIGVLRAAGALKPLSATDGAGKVQGRVEWAAYCVAPADASALFTALARAAPARPKTEYHLTVAFGAESMRALRAEAPPARRIAQLSSTIVRSRTAEGDLAAVLVEGAIVVRHDGASEAAAPHITCWLSGTRRAADAGPMLARRAAGAPHDGEAFDEFSWAEGVAPRLPLDLRTFAGHYAPLHSPPQWRALRAQAGAACAANTAGLGDALAAELDALESRCSPIVASHGGAAQCSAMWRVGVDAIRPMVAAALYCSTTAAGAAEYAAHSWQHWAWLSGHPCVGAHDEDVALWPSRAQHPQGFKVQAANKKRGPDDVVYKMEIDLRRNVPRGLVFVGAKLALYGLRKVSV